MAKNYMELHGTEDDKCLRNMFANSSDSDDDDSVQLDAVVEQLDAKDVEGSNISYFTCINGNQIAIETNRVLGIAFQLWPAASLLCRYIEENYYELVPHPQNTYVIELGAGVGLCGIHMASLSCAHVLVTDLPEAMELIQKNIDHNRHLYSSHTKIQPAVLSWGRQEEYIACTEALSMPTDSSLLMIAADCVYWECLYEPFIDCLLHFTQTYKATVILAHVKRWKKEKKFFSMCSKKMKVEVVSEKVELVEDLDQQQTTSPDCDDAESASIVDSDVKSSEVDHVSMRYRRQVSRVYKISCKD